MIDKSLLEDKKVRIQAIAVAIAVLLILFRGISTGLDLRGGSLIQIQTERPLSPSEMDRVASIMDQRMRGGLGVRDVSVTPWGEEFLIIRIAGVAPEEAEKLVGKPGKLLVRIGNVTAFTGEELQRVDPFGRSSASGSWGVPFTITQEAARRFRDAAVATNFEFVNMYMDEGSRITATTDRKPDEDLLERMGFAGSGKMSTSETSLAGFVTVLTLDLTLEEIGERGKEKIEGALQAGGLREIKYERSGLVNSAPISPNLQEELAAGQVVRSLILETGSSDEARLDAKRIEAILRSGALPIRVSIVGSFGVSPALGEDFTRSAIGAGILAIIGVSAVIYARYRRPLLVVPVIVTGLSEVAMILGVASLINWDIDLPAIAGIIAAIGTGVDNQIVILDEIMLQRERSIRFRIQSAFFIVMGSYFTLVAAMMPLFLIGLGMLEGFAITTIIGATTGVFITRPAFARIAEQLLAK